MSELRSTKLLEGEALLREHEKRTEDAEKTQKTIGIMKKLRWAIVDKEKFETLITEVSKFINDLYSLISPLDARILAKAVAGELLRTTNLQRVTDIRSAAQGTREDVAALATRRRRALLSVQKGQSIPKMMLPGGCKSLSESKTADIGNRIVAIYQDEDGIAKHVMVEWKALPATASESGPREIAHQSTPEQSRLFPSPRRRRQRHWGSSMHRHNQRGPNRRSDQNWARFRATQLHILRLFAIVSLRDLTKG